MALSHKEILNLFERSEALLQGHFILTSGKHSPNYFQCAKVLQYPEFLTLLCWDISDHFKTKGIDVVISPAIGGVVVGTEVGRQLNVKTIFAERKEGQMMLRRGFELKKGEKVLVVEDVITTGGSVKEVIDIVKEHGAEVCGVACIVDRSNGKVKLAEDQHCLLPMEVVMHEPDSCPLCEEKKPLIKPGSRTSPVVQS